MLSVPRVAGVPAEFAWMLMKMLAPQSLAAVKRRRGLGAIVRDVGQLVLQVLSGVYEVVSNGRDLLSIEQGVHRTVSEATRKLLTIVLGERDEELAASRDKTGLRHVGKNRLDPYYLRRALREALGPDTVSYQAVCEGVAAGDWPAVDSALAAAAGSGSAAR